MRLFLMGLLICLSTFQAKANLLTDLKFDTSTNLLQMTVVYNGGLKEHKFDLIWESCSPAIGGSSLKQSAARLVDSGWDDTGTDNFEVQLEFPLSDFACSPAELTVFADKSHKTIQIP